MKGAVDAVKTAVAALERGLDIEMHYYGQGSQFDDMQRIANAHGRSRVHVHNAVPYAELVRRSRKFDAFVCCHVQNDPSCTYIESMGAGLPIAGRSATRGSSTSCSGQSNG